jgi:predicted O-methyltransferase YrrM
MATMFESIEGWFDFEDIYELALRRSSAHKPARFVEIGAYKGRSACYLAERIAETGKPIRFDVVDTFAGDPDVGERDLWPEFSANLALAGVLSRVEAHRSTSVAAAPQFADGSLDFVFLDARHTFEAVQQDLAAWWPKLRPGGLFAGHDYQHWPGVRAAVDAFVAARGLGHAFRISRTSWMIYKSLAIDAAYCLNLQRRADRRERAAAQFGAAGLSGTVAFFDAIDGATLEHPRAISDGQVGCAASHLAVLRAAREAGHRHVLVFEDDVELVPDFLNRVTTSLARCPATYDLCYVGALCVEAWGNYLHPFDQHVARVGSVCGTHAYIVNMEAQPEIEAGLGNFRRVIDNWYAAWFAPRGDTYTFAPYLAFQAAGFSDIAQAHNGNSAHAHYIWR